MTQLARPTNLPEGQVLCVWGPLDEQWVQDVGPCYEVGATHYRRMLWNTNDSAFEVYVPHGWFEGWPLALHPEAGVKVRRALAKLD